jgi:hypothetical protein
MKKLIALGLVATVIVATALSASRPATAQKIQARFYCGQSYNPKAKKIMPTTFVATSAKSEPISLIRWESAVGEYTPQLRCNLVSQKFQSAWKSGNLKYITAGTDKSTRQGIICGLATPTQTCDASKQLFTLRSGRDAEGVISSINDIRVGRAGVINQSGGDNIVDLEELLK